MKKAFVYKIFAMLIGTVLLLSGCGKKEEPTPISEATSLTKEAIEDSSESLDEDIKNNDNEENSATEEKITPLAEECTKAYQDFLNGDNEVWFELYDKTTGFKAIEWAYDDIEKYISPETPYSMSEMTLGICNGIQDFYYTGIVAPSEIRYAYLDCGNDSVPELIIEYVGIGEDSVGSNVITVIKLIDDKLQCIFQGSYAYRGFAEVNEYGVYTYSGANGAASYNTEYSYINADGETLFLYGVNYDASAYSLYIPNNEEFVKSCTYTYDILDGEEYHEGYDRFWKSTGLTLSTEEEVEDMIKDIEEQAGVSEEIINGEAISWISLDEEAMSKIVTWETSSVKYYVLDSPDWLFENSGQLFVRCYDTDYVFEIND